MSEKKKVETAEPDLLTLLYQVTHTLILTK